MLLEFIFDMIIDPIIQCFYEKILKSIFDESVRLPIRIVLLIIVIGFFSIIGTFLFIMGTLMIKDSSFVIGVASILFSCFLFYFCTKSLVEARKRSQTNQITKDNN